VGCASYVAIDPYSGCELACATCPARSLKPFADAPFAVFERDIHPRVNAAEAVAQALREGGLRGTPLVLGTRADPWQPAEKKARVTRAVLESLVGHAGLDLRARTRSTLAPRDADLFHALGLTGRAELSVAIGTLDFRLARLLEPLAPTPDRRFVALEALARAGVRAGIHVSPVLPGLNDASGALDGLLRRARDAGARFASAAPLVLAPEARLKVVGHVAKYDPELATRYDRLLRRTADFEPGFSEKLRERFADLCARHGLEDAGDGNAAEAGAQRGPSQLELFAPLHRKG
jgi:DNA repair photolyase